MTVTTGGLDRAPVEGSGARIRALRTDRGVSQTVLAARLGISASALSQLENGRTAPSTARLVQVARELAAPAAQLLGPSAEPENEPPERDWRRFLPLKLDPVATAAAEAFIEVGYHGASMRDIAGRAGLSVPALYHYHASKQDLLVAVLDVLMADLGWRMRQAAGDAGGCVERFRLLVECLALEHTHRSAIASIGHNEMRSLEPRNRRRIAGLRNEVQRMVTETVRAGVAEGHFAAPHPGEAARAVVTLCTALVQWFRPDGPATPEQIAARYVDIALDVVRAVSRDRATAG